MMIPAMGTITFSDSPRIIWYMLLSHEEGVLPTSAAIVPTLSLTSVNILVMLLSIQPIRSSFMASSIFSRINPNISPPFGYAGVAGSEQARQERDKGRADEYHTTTGHQLTHTSGLEWYEWAGRSNWQEFRTSENWVDYILNRNLISTPGSSFAYSTGNSHLLAAALENATGMGELEFAHKNLFDALGMNSVVWGMDPQGVADGGNGIAMTVQDAARFGQLYLQGGQWNGEQLIPAQWVKQSTTAKNNGAGDGTGSYGYQWWIRSFQGYDTFYAFGAHGQFIFVVPQLELVTVIASHSLSDSYAPRPYFSDYILSAYTG